MKSLESIVTSKDDTYTTLMSLLPDRIERLRSQTKEVLGIEGFLYKDLRDSLVKEGYAFTPTSLKSAIGVCGYRAISIVVPNSNGERVTIFTVDSSFSGVAR